MYAQQTVDSISIAGARFILRYAEKYGILSGAGFWSSDKTIDIYLNYDSEIRYISMNYSPQHDKPYLTISEYYPNGRESVSFIEFLKLIKEECNTKT